MLKQSVTAIVALVLMSAPAWAASVPYCPDRGNVIEFMGGFTVGEEMTEMEQNEMFLRQLRHLGVKASGVTMWNGCVRAFVKNADGHGEHMEFFYPDTLEPVILDR